MSSVGPTPRLMRELGSLAGRLYPDSQLVGVDELGPDAGHGENEKAAGYGRVLRLTLRDSKGGTRRLTFHTANSDEYGHDRRSDRAAEMLLAYDDFRGLPSHVRPVDVGAVLRDGRLESLRDAGEFYLVSSWAEGQLYVDDLRRLAATGLLTALDGARSEALIGYLGELHSAPPPNAIGWRRAIRDLLGHGEGIFGVIDAYPADTPAAPPARLQAIEASCLAWRWRLRDRTERLRRTHGDFHPFNIVFDGSTVTLLDASRGCLGDPADDVTALAINYVFFALQHPGSWRPALGVLWHRLWNGYLARTGDAGLWEVAAPFLAWRSLVVASPRFYPGLAEPVRDALLRLAERALAHDRFDPGWADELFP